MAFKLRPLHDVFGIHKDSEFGKPIILKDEDRPTASGKPT